MSGSVLQIYVRNVVKAAGNRIHYNCNLLLSYDDIEIV